MLAVWVCRFGWRARSGAERVKRVSVSIYGAMCGAFVFEFGGLSRLEVPFGTLLALQCAGFGGLEVAFGTVLTL